MSIIDVQTHRHAFTHRLGRPSKESREAHEQLLKRNILIPRNNPLPHVHRPIPRNHPLYCTCPVPSRERVRCGLDVLCLVLRTPEVLWEGQHTLYPQSLPDVERVLPRKDSRASTAAFDVQADLVDERECAAVDLVAPPEELVEVGVPELRAALCFVLRHALRVLHLVHGLPDDGRGRDRMHELVRSEKAEECLHRRRGVAGGKEVRMCV